MKYTILFILIFFNLTFSENVKGDFLFVTQNFKPYSYKENGEAAGPVVTIIQKICNDLELSYRIEIHPWARCQDMVLKGDANALFVLARSEQRDKQLYFSSPIFDIEYGFFVHSSNTLQYKNVAQLSNYIVGVFGPSNSSNILEDMRKDNKNFTIDIRPESSSGFKKLSSKRVDAVFSNRDVGFCTQHNNGIDNVRYAGMYKKTNYHIGFSKNYADEDKVNKFNDHYELLLKDGTIKKILDKYSLKLCLCK